MVLILPAAQGALYLPDCLLRFYPSNHRDDHPARTIVVAVKSDKIVTLDLLDRFRESILRTTVRMALEEDAVEYHGSHIRRIFRSNRQARQ